MGLSNRLPRHASNPFSDNLPARSELVYCPDDYTLSTIVRCSAQALRLLYVIAANVDPATGISHCPHQKVRGFILSHPTNIRNACLELNKAKLIAYAKGYHQYYVNPNAFRALTITF